MESSIFDVSTAYPVYVILLLIGGYIFSVGRVAATVDKSSLTFRNRWETLVVNTLLSCVYLWYVFAIQHRSDPVFPELYMPVTSIIDFVLSTIWLVSIFHIFSGVVLLVGGRRHVRDELKKHSLGNNDE